MLRQILIIDDHPVVLAGFRRLIEDAAIGEVLEAGTIAAGYRRFRRHRPDMVVVDLAMQAGRLSGLALLTRLRQQNSRVPILVFSMHRDSAIVSRALEAGATGYLLKDTDVQEMLIALRTVVTGTPYLSHALATEIAFSGSRHHRSPLEELTSRELQTLSLLADGQSYGRIASELNVSYKTIVNTASQIKAKLGVSTLPELVCFAVQALATGPANHTPVRMTG